MISDNEFQEMKFLKNLINENPFCVSPDYMERFTELFVESIREYDGVINSNEDTLA